MTFHSEVVLTKRHDCWCNLRGQGGKGAARGQGGEEQIITPKIVPFSVSPLAVVTDKVETPIYVCVCMYV